MCAEHDQHARDRGQVRTDHERQRGAHQPPEQDESAICQEHAAQDVGQKMLLDQERRDHDQHGPGQPPGGNAARLPGDQGIRIDVQAHVQAGEIVIGRVLALLKIGETGEPVVSQRIGLLHLDGQVAE